MLDMQKVIDRAEWWLNKYPPNTGYTLGILNLMKQKLAKGEYPSDMNIVTQFMLQYDGKAGFGDVTVWDPRWPEIMLPYSQLKRMSPDQSMDCSSFPRFVFYIFFGIDIGTYTENQYYTIPKIGGWDVGRDVLQWRPLDLIQYNFKSWPRHASHDSTYIGGGKIIHTRSKTHPMQIDSATYAKDSIVKVWRILSASQYLSSFVGKEDIGVPDPDPAIPVYTRTLKFTKPVMSGADVWWIQYCLNAKIHPAGFQDRYGTWRGTPLETDAKYGTKTEGAVYHYQTRHPECGKANGIVNEATWDSVVGGISG